MADLPKIRSKEQILSDLIDGFIARAPQVNDFNRNSVISQFFTSVAQSQFRASSSVIGMADAMSVDRAVGDALQRLARDKMVPIYSATASTGTISITDSSFQKIQSQVYSGQAAPVAGSLIVYVADASKFTQTNGTVYIGTETSNAEGPLEYISVQAESGGSYWSITLKSTSPTTRFHNIGESVIMGQGGTRTIKAGSIVQTAAGGASSPVQFVTTYSAIIQDGETDALNVPVRCQSPGIVGNVPRGSVQEIIGLPFSALVFNDQAFSNGKEADNDDAIRIRIKAYEVAKAKGTERAIQLAAADVIAPDELKKVQSAATVRYTDDSVALVFDDGSGYESIYSGSGFEYIVDEALGGEKELQLRRKPLAQARIKSNVSGPYNIPNFSYLSVTIQGITKIHQFLSSSFKVASSATAFEVATAINGNPNIHFLATTAEGGTKVLIFPRERNSNDIRVNSLSANDANSVIGFNNITDYTLRLYKNDQPLYQDGLEASISTRAKADWSPGIQDGDNLTYKVDGSTEVNAEFKLATFQSVDPTSTVSYLTSLDIWAAVMNKLMPGVTAIVDNDVLDIKSNRGKDTTASLEITGGSLKSKMFSLTDSLSSSGRKADYTLNKWTGQLAVADPLLPGDKLTAGSPFTRAKVTTNSIPSGSSSAGSIWVIVDGATQAVANGLKTTTQIAVNKPASSAKMTISGISTLTSTIEGFDQAKSGDWLLIWNNDGDAAGLINSVGFWRIESAQVGQLIVDYGAGPLINESFVPPTDRIVIVRSLAPIQKASFGILTLSGLADSLKSQLLGCDIEITGGSLRISTKTAGPNGELFFVASDNGGKNLGITVGSAIQNIPTHYGYVTTKNSEANIPSFSVGIFSAAGSDKQFTDINFAEIGGQENDFIEMLDRYDIPSQSDVIDSNKGCVAAVTGFDPSISTVTLNPPAYMLAGQSVIQADDRYFIRSSYQFDSQDTSTVVIDTDNITKGYNLPVSRKLVVNNLCTPSNQHFSADDAQSSLALKDSSSFGTFDFKDFKLWRRASTILTDGSTYSISISAGDFGPSGNRIRVGFVYPTAITQTTLAYTATTSDLIDIGLQLPVKTPRTANWTQYSSFTTNVTTTDGKDTITFTHRVGQTPDFITSGVVSGDVAIVNSSSHFLNGNKDYSARVTGVASTSFTVDMPTGSAVNDNLAASGILNSNPSGSAGVIEVSTAPNKHNIKSGQMIALWNTAIANGTIGAPFDAVYTPKIKDDYTFTVPAPINTPGGTIYSVSRATSGTVTAVVNNHGLSVGNVILVESVSDLTFCGTYTVTSIIDPNTFTYSTSNVIPVSIITSGHVRFESYGLTGLSKSISSIVRSGYTVTATSALHGFTTGDLVKINGTDIETYDPTATYASNTVTKFNSLNWAAKTAVSPITKTLLGVTLSSYIITGTGLDLIGLAAGMKLQNHSLVPANTFPDDTYIVSVAPTAITVNNTSSATVSNVTLKFNQLNPDVNPTMWQLTTQTLNGQFSVTVINSNTFTYHSDSSGDITGLAQGQAQKMTTQASLARPIGGANSDYLSFAEIGTTVQEVVDYITTSMLESLVAKVMSGATANISTSTYDINSVSNYLSGNISSIQKTVSSRTVKLLSDTLAIAGSTIRTSNLPTGYNDTFIVTNTEQVGISYLLTVITQVKSSSTVTLPVGGTFTGETDLQALADGENGISSSDLAATIGSPMFIAKHPWINPPSIGEELYVIASNNDQLSRFWSKLIVTGLSNSAKIDSSEYGRQLQLTTQTFGSNGSIQVTGGLANAGTVAIVGSASVHNGRQGLLNIPYELRKGLVAREWITIDNENKQYKQIGFDSTTSISVLTNGIQITSGSGSFSTLRPTNTHTGSTMVKIEKHGDFYAFIRISGPSFNLNTSGVTEGDWVRINGGNINSANQGIFRVVRTFGEDAFWVESSILVEEIKTLGDASSLKFYSYDSAMPGDVLVVSTDIFGTNLVGRYEVLSSPAFPTNSVIYTSPIASNTVPTKQLGGSFNQINIEEKAPLRLWKRIYTVGQSNDGYASVLTDSPELMNKVSSTVGGYITMKCKLGYNTDINYGIDAYKYYGGLVKELTRVIYGDPLSPTAYPGIKAGGTSIDIKPAVIKRISADLSVRIRTGVPFGEVRDKIKASVAGYVNTLNVGEQVSLSRIVTAAGSVSGVIAVSVLYPAYDVTNDLIAIGADERAMVIDSTTDITVSVVGS